MHRLHPHMYLPLSKHQSRLGLGIVVAGGRAANEHGGATVSTQGILQDAGHLTVTIRHVSFLQESGRWTRGKKWGTEDRDEREKTSSVRFLSCSDSSTDYMIQQKCTLSYSSWSHSFGSLRSPKLLSKSGRLIVPHPTNLIIGRDSFGIWRPNPLSWQKGKRGAGCISLTKSTGGTDSYCAQVLENERRGLFSCLNLEINTDSQFSSLNTINTQTLVWLESRRRRPKYKCNHFLTILPYLKSTSIILEAHSLTCDSGVYMNRQKMSESGSPCPQPRQRWRFPEQKETCWCF